MAKTILTDIDLQQNEVQNAVLENRATAPTSPKPGQQYFDTTDNTVKTYNGTEWTSGGSGGGTTITVDTALSTSSTNPVQNKVVTNAINGKQATLVSGTTIKTINGESVLGSGNITISGGGGDSIVYYNEENNYIGINDYDTSASNTISIGGKTNNICHDTIVIGNTNIPAPASGCILLGNNHFETSNIQSMVKSVCIGSKFVSGDRIDPFILEGTVLFRASSFPNTQTDFYFMGADSLFASAYCGGEAGFGYISFDLNGNIVGRGTCKLSSICTENTDSFDPARIIIPGPQ